MPKQGALSDHVITLRHRLHESLSLGLKYNGEQEMKWHCIDAGIESHALKKIDSFINCLTFSLSQHPLIKESILEIVTALTGILQSKNIATLKTTIEVTSNLVRKIRTHIREFPILNIISSLSNVFSLNQSSPITKSSCIALNAILTNSGALNNAKIGEILEKDNIIGFISLELQGLELVEVHTIEYFVELMDLLRTIILRWPQLRFRVWGNDILMQKLEEKCGDKELSISTNVLKICSSLALCSHGAKKMVQNKSFVSKVIKCSNKSNPISIRSRSLILLRHLIKSGEDFSLLTNTHCEAITKEIINSLSIFKSLNDPSKQMPLILEASRTALVLVSHTGSHHSQFWSKKFDQIMLDIISRRFENKNNINRQSLLANKEILEVDKIIWDIFGYLVSFCEENFEGQFCNLDNLISCACSWTANSLGRTCRISEDILELDEPVSRTVLLMLLSPCNYIARNSSCNLSELIEPYSKFLSPFVTRFLSTLQLFSQTGTVPTCQSVIDLTNLACLLFLPPYQTLILKNNGIEILSGFIKTRARSDILIGREKISSHLDNIYEGKNCCMDSVNKWEGGDITLFYSLISLSKLLEISNCTLPDSTIDILRDILNNEQFGEGPRLYSKYILDLYGLHGSQSEMDEKISEAFDMDEFADVTLLFSKGDPFRVHGAIIIAKCPKLLPPNLEFPSKNNPKIIVKISDRVDREALGIVLEHIYSRFILRDNFDEGFLRKIKLIAKNCRLESLLEMLNKDRPKWGSCGPHFDLTRALEPHGFPFSDVILEAKSNKQIECKCTTCHLLTPHVHAHKIILCLSCDYLRALFRSGMHESLSGTIKVPLGYEALLKLTEFFYSGKIPKVNLDCKWRSLTDEEKSTELKAYVELSSLAEYWCWEEIAEEASESVLDCIACNVLEEIICVKLIRFATDLGRWRIVEAGVRNLAPKYPKLRAMECFDEFGEEMKEILRVEYVKSL